MTVTLGAIRARVALVLVLVDVVLRVDAPIGTIILRCTRLLGTFGARLALLDIMREIASHGPVGRVPHHRSGRAAQELVEVRLVTLPHPENPASGWAFQIVVRKRAPAIVLLAHAAGRAAAADGRTPGRVDSVQRVPANALRKVDSACDLGGGILGALDALSCTGRGDRGTKRTRHAVGAQMKPVHVLVRPGRTVGTLGALLERTLRALGALHALLRLLIES
mmetsp:Transcript_44787/g.91413  ORF Transcript_44787/g.91413 Transcript_44787/m.91413 type:complete len:222 (-) Transcript_44787:678-1343(-)